MANSFRFSLLSLLVLLLGLISLVSAECDFTKQTDCLIGGNATRQYEACHSIICTCDFTKDAKCAEHFCEGGPMTVASRPCPESVLGQFYFRPRTCCMMAKDKRSACLEKFSNSKGAACQNFNAAAGLGAPSFVMVGSIIAAVAGAMMAL